MQKWKQQRRRINVFRVDKIVSLPKYQLPHHRVRLEQSTNQTPSNAHPHVAWITSVVLYNSMDSQFYRLKLLDTFYALVAKPEKGLIKGAF